MQLGISQKRLARALDVVGAAADLRGDRSPVVFEAERGALRLRRRTQDVCVQVSMGVDVERKGGVAIRGDRVRAIVAAMTAGPMTLSSESPTKLTVSQGRFRSVLEGETLDGIPQSPGGDPHAQMVDIQNAVLLDVLRSVSYAMGDDERRPVLSGVHLQRRRDSIRSVATDGQRAAIHYTRANEVPETPMLAAAGIVLCRSAVLVAIQLLEQAGEGMVRMSVEHGRLVLGMSLPGMEEVTLHGSLLEGTYPDVDKVVPNHKREVTLSADVEDALRRVVKMADGHRVALRLDDDVVVMHAQSAERGDASDVVDAPGARNDVPGTAANARFILDALSHVGAVPTLAMGEAFDALVFRGGRDVAVVMPMR